MQTCVQDAGCDCSGGGGEGSKEKMKFIENSLTAAVRGVYNIGRFRNGDTEQRCWNLSERTSGRM